MLWKAVTLLALAICARGERPATSEQMLKQEFVLQHGHHGELNHIGSHQPEHHEEYAWAYPSYEFSYTVNDPHTHDHKGQYEHRKGDEVKGEYWLLQPDGKKRTVKYEANKHMGFKAHVHYSEHHEHNEEPHIEEIIKPVVEIVPEPLKPVEESEPILVAEIPEAVVEERQEEQEPEPEIERVEPVRHKPKHHKPIHIEYYINHKYPKHDHEENAEHHKRAEPEEERREEEGTQGQEARIQESEEPRVEVKHRKPVHIEHYAKIHHPIHNEHHGHEIPKHSAPASIIVHHDDHEAKRVREEHQHHGHKEELSHGRQRVREEHREELREHEGLRGWGEHLGHEERRREEHHGHEEHREREEHGWREHRGREEHERDHHLPLVPLRREPYYGHRRYEHREDYRHEPHDQLLRLHKPVMFRPENAHHHPRSLRQEKKA